MTVTRDDIVRWWIEVDDPLELMKVNWQRHNQFTQNGMWTVGDETIVLGIRLLMEHGDGSKGYLLHIYDNDSDTESFVAIATYEDKCQECGVQPHDARWFDGNLYDEEYGGLNVETIDAWATGVIHGMWENAQTGGFEFNHQEGCQNGALTMKGDDDAPEEDQESSVVDAS